MIVCKEELGEHPDWPKYLEVALLIVEQENGVLFWLVSLQNEFGCNLVNQVLVRVS